MNVNRRGATCAAPAPGVLAGRVDLFALAASALLSAALLAAGAAGAAEPDREVGIVEEESGEEWFARMAAYYEAHPELVTQKGSGWKPYNRVKWFYEQRTSNGEPVPVGARYEAWKVKREMEARLALAPRATWFSLGPANFSGRILQLEFDPTDGNVLYAGSAGGGLWRSNDAGLSWTPLTDELPSLAIGGVAVLPSDPNVIVIGTGEGTPNIDRISGIGILRSTDGGASWIETSVTYSKANGHGFHALGANPITGTLLAAATDGLWRSTDAGANWTQVRVGGNHYDVAWKPGDANVCYTVRGGSGSGNGIKVSTDDGLTWAQAGTGQPTGTSIGKTRLAVSADEPGWIYAGIANRGNSTLLGIYRSTDTGATWTLQANTPNMYGGQGWYDVSLVADPNDANRVISGGVQLYRSTDAGVTFNVIGNGAVSVHVDHHAAAYRPGSPNDVFVGSDGGVWASTNDGSTWADRNAGLVTFQFYDICVSQSLPNWVMGGTQDQGTDKWSGSTTWAEGLGADGMVCNINPNADDVVYAEIQSGDHYKNTSGGGPAGWTQINNGIVGSGAWVTPVAEDQQVGNHLYTATPSVIYRTTNGGNLWVNVSNHSATWIDISPVDGDVVWTIAGSLVRRTTDDGATWTTAAPFGFPTGSGTKIAAHPTDPAAALATFSSYSPGVAHVARTTDFGASWTNATGNLPNAPVSAIAIDPLQTGRYFIGTDIGVWETTDGGANWVPFETGLPNTVVVDLEIQKTTRKLVAGTHGRGAWEVDIGGGATSAEVGAPRPIHLLLDPPSPNPVSRGTTLRFAAKHPGTVTLSIYDVTGRLVHEAARSPVGDGIIRLARWEADDAPSGVYFAVLQAGESKLTRKIVVAK